MFYCYFYLIYLIDLFFHFVFIYLWWKVAEVTTTALILCVFIAKEESCVLMPFVWFCRSSFRTFIVISCGPIQLLKALLQHTCFDWLDLLYQRLPLTMMAYAEWAHSIFVFFLWFFSSSSSGFLWYNVAICYMRI